MEPDDQGTHEASYSIIPRNLIFLTKDNDILLLKGAPKKRLWASKFNGIGGHIEPGENPLESARRELREETGLEAIQLELRAIIHITMPQPPGIILFVFIGEATTRTLLSSAEGTPQWVPLTKYQELDLVDDLYTLLPHILKPGPLLYGTYILDNDGLHITFEPFSETDAHGGPRCQIH
jgi:8-oxo-dGTP diphosphatase